MINKKFEASWSGNATLQGEIPVWAFGTAHTTLKDDGYWYDKGYGMLISLDNSVAKYTYSSIGKMMTMEKLKALDLLHLIQMTIQELYPY